MFGRKDKKADRKRGREKGSDRKEGGDLATMFGLNMEIPDDAALEAELMALEGASPGPAGGGRGKAPMSVSDVNKMVAGIGDVGDSDLSDLDEDELLGELQALEDEAPSDPPPPIAPLKPQPPPHQAPKTVGGSVAMVSARLDMYRAAMEEADKAGESSKLKRYKRGVSSLEQLLKSAQKGRSVSEEELPPVVVVKSVPQQQPAKQSSINLDDPEFDEFNFDDSELAAMASSMVDDRHSSVQSQPPTQISPRQQTTPIMKPTEVNRGTVPPKLSQNPIKPSVLPRQPAPSKPSPSPRQQAPMPPKPSPRQQAPPTKPAGMIDLDAPEFDEFNLSEDDLVAMTMAFVDDRKKPKLDEPVTMETSKPSASLPARIAPPPSKDEGTVTKLLAERRDQYIAASKGNKGKEREYRVIAAQFSRVVKALEGGGEVDLSQMPGPPPGYKSSYNIDINKYTPNKTQTTPSLKEGQSPSSSLTQGQSPSSSLAQGQSPSSSLAQGPSSEDVNSDIAVPKTTMEALEQRLAKYQDGVKSAKDKGESSRVRRLGRIVKSYEDAIKATKANKQFDYDELPTPPGYPPIPVPRTLKPRPPIVPPTQSLPVAMAAKPRPPSLNQDQLRLIDQRRSELQSAAKQEQSKGNRERALHYLKLRKGLDTMLEAARSGLPVNLEELPLSPFADLTKTKPSSDVLSHLKPATDEDAATFDLLEKQLQKQCDICDSNAETYRKMGSTPASIQYENMSQNCQRELLAIKGIRSQGLGPPKFTMETRKFTIVNSHPELSSGVCEVEVVRGLNIPKPEGFEEKDMNVYVEVEFPWPADSPAKDSTATVKHSCHPEFIEAKLSFEIDRKKIKTMTRMFKRTPVKCGVWQKRALRRDLFIGLGSLSLEGLESRCNVGATVDLTDEKGRKQVGGKLEIAARLREPLSGTDKEERDEQWLVFKEAIAAKSSVSMPKPGQPSASGKSSPSANFALLSPIKVENMVSLEALKFELSLVQSALKAGHRDRATSARGRQIQDRTATLKQKLQSDASFRQSYSRLVAREMASEQQLEAQLVKQGKGKQVEAVILGKRRAAMEREIKALQSRKL